MADALTYITVAEQTVLLVIDPEKCDGRFGDLPGMDAAHYLARHGGNVRSQTENSYGRPINEVILSVAAKENADLIVMGAYSKPRRRQLLFGGVTRSMLSDIRITVLISLYAVLQRGRRLGMRHENDPDPRRWSGPTLADALVELHAHWGWFVGLGIVLLALGGLA